MAEKTGPFFSVHHSRTKIFRPEHTAPCHIGPRIRRILWFPFLMQHFIFTTYYTHTEYNMDQRSMLNPIAQAARLCSMHTVKTADCEAHPCCQWQLSRISFQRDCLHCFILFCRKYSHASYTSITHNNYQKFHLQSHIVNCKSEKRKEKECH